MELLEEMHLFHKGQDENSPTVERAASLVARHSWREMIIDLGIDLDGRGNLTRAYASQIA